MAISGNRLPEVPSKSSMGRVDDEVVCECASFWVVVRKELEFVTRVQEAAGVSSETKMGGRSDR